MGMNEETVAEVEDVAVAVETAIEKEVRGAEMFQVLLGIAYFTTIFTLLG